METQGDIQAYIDDFSESQSLRQLVARSHAPIIVILVILVILVRDASLIAECAYSPSLEGPKSPRELLEGKQVFVFFKIPQSLEASSKFQKAS